MNPPSSWFKKDLHALLLYGTAVFLCLALLTGVMRLWRANLSVPFAYEGDNLMILVWIKGVLDNGWYLHNGFVGAPAGLDMHDFPMADNLHFLLIKLIGLATADYAITFNLYLLLTYPLTTVSTLFVLRRFEVSSLPALLGSLLFTFVPYHFFRASCHLFLAAYFLVPMMVMVILWVYLDREIFFRREETTGRLWRSFLSARSLGSMAICLLMASAGVYYAFFACYFLLVAGSIASLHRKCALPLLTAVLLTGIISAGLLVNLSPSLLYRYTHGPNPEALHRGREHAEVYGLKITQLLLPATGHRLGCLAQWKATYNSMPELLINENDYASLGVLGSIGFLVLIGRLFYRKPSPGRLWDGLTALNAAALLLGTTGGLGSLFSLLVGPWIRGYNRISIYIAFFAFFALALALDGVLRRCTASWKKLLLYGLVAGLLLVGVWDQTGTTKEFRPSYGRSREDYDNQATFVHAIEATAPANALILQLPYVPFPEAAVDRMGGYELLRGYLHSSSLRWSHGAMRGRPGDLWLRTVSDQPPESLLRTLALTGFDGLSLDRAFYADHGAAVEGELSRQLDTPPLKDATGRFVFFNLGEHNRRLKAHSSAQEWACLQEEALHPVTAAWCSGFAALEGPIGARWRWCSSRGELRLVNSSPRTKTITLKMLCQTGGKEVAHLWLESACFSSHLDLDARGVTVTRMITIAPGTHVIHFLCGPNRDYVAHDPRTWVFKVTGFGIEERAPPSAVDEDATVQPASLPRNDPH